jgi:hypothetical protein
LTVCPVAALKARRPGHFLMNPIPTRWREVFNVIGIYLATVGGVAAGAQVARGAVGGAGRLARGDPRGALTELAGGVTAPVVSAVHQFSQLGADVCRSVAALTAEVRGQAGRLRGMKRNDFSPRTGGPGRGENLICRLPQ